MTLRAIFFDLGGVILRTEYQAPRERLAERLNMTYEDVSRVVFEAETARESLHRRDQRGGTLAGGDA